MLGRKQRDRSETAAAALEQHAGHDGDPLTSLEAAAELRRVVRDWDAASASTSDDTVHARQRDALRRIANAESGVWGWIARDALDHREAPAGTTGDLGATPDAGAGPRATATCAASAWARP